MRFCRYQLADGSTGLGAAFEDGIVSLSALDPSLVDNMEALMGDQVGLSALWQQAQQTPRLEGSPRFLAPILKPEKVICVGLNYRDHAIETNSPIPSEPVIFNKFPSTLIGPEDTIVLPPESERVDYEAELVVVIGKTCHRVSTDNALDYVFGYSCGHDVSARDWQKGKPGGQWLLGKTFDTFAPLGPYVAHKSSIADPGKLSIQFRLNGETLQDSNTEQLIFSIPEVISYLSQVVTLKPGDLIYTGTPSGVGDARTPPRYLNDGDVCEVEIEGLGVLSNPCKRE